MPDLPFPFPAEDRALSPHTGYTRAHWEAVADGLLAALEPYATPGRGLYHLPGPRPSHSGPRSDGFEGYARTFLLAAFRVAGSGGHDPHGLLQRYADGLAAGTRNPGGDGPEDWPAIEDRRQPLVESACVALALRLTRPWLWDRLPTGVRERAGVWLTAAAEAESHPNNWMWFPATVAGLLSDVGLETPGSRRALERAEGVLEEWYVGDGWYTDGYEPLFDYYNGWALHLYPVLHAWLGEDKAKLEFYGRRLHRHLHDYQRLFGGDGRPMYQGRSLTYRTAVCTPLWLGALTGHTPLSPGRTRRLASGALRHFVDNGAVGADGLLPLGWFGESLSLVQGYSGPGSPYWASKGFLGLLLPAGHRVWTAREEDAPNEEEDATTVLPGPHWLVQSTRSDGIVRLHNHGTAHANWVSPHYNRDAFSTHTAPCEDGTAHENDVVLEVEGAPPGRAHPERLGSGEGWIASSRAVGEARITSVTLARGAVEVRAHLVSGAPAGTRVSVSGWAAGDPVRAELAPVHGLSGPADERPFATPFSPAARAQTLAGLTAGIDTLFAAVARLTGEPSPRPLADLVRVDVTGDGIDVAWTDGPVQRVRIAPGAVSVA